MDGKDGASSAESRVSVVVAAYRGADTIADCIASIEAQSAPAELVVIDGGSTDGTVDIINLYASSIAYWESEPDRGVYHAWNKALDHVTGEWVCFLGADDRFAAPDVLARIAPHLPDASDIRVAYATVHVVDPSGAVVVSVGEPWAACRVAFRERMTLPNPATFYHRSLFEELGRFDERFRITGDYEFLLRELLAREALFIPDVVAVLMDDGGLSSDPRHRARRVREIATARHMHGLTRVPPWAAPAVIKASTRDSIERTLGPKAADWARRWYRAITRQPPDE